MSIHMCDLVSLVAEVCNKNTQICEQTKGFVNYGSLRLQRKKLLVKKSLTKIVFMIENVSFSILRHIIAKVLQFLSAITNMYV